jgi:hypothetical protein
LICVYTIPRCAGSDRARELVEWVLEHQPDAAIKVIDVSKCSELPDSVFALPTWYLDDQVWKLGNPSNEELLAAIKKDKLGSDGHLTEASDMPR